MYNYLESKEINDREKLNLIPECACYFPLTREQQFFPSGTPRICFTDGCNSNEAYLDPTSINPDGTPRVCDMTVCQNIIDTSNLSTEGGNANIGATLENNCGQYMPQEPEPRPQPQPQPLLRFP